MKYSADTYLSVKGTLIFIRCPLASRKASPEIFNLRGFEMLFYIHFLLEIHVQWHRAITRCHGTEKMFVIAGSSL